MEKGYTKKRNRRKIPKVGRSYNRHMNEDKTFDKSKDINDLVEEHVMSIEKEIEEMAGKMEKSTQDPKAELAKTVKELGPEGIRKAMPELNEEQRELLKSVLEEMAKGSYASCMKAMKGYMGKGMSKEECMSKMMGMGYEKSMCEKAYGECSKGMEKAVAFDDKYAGDKKFVKLAQAGTEEENGSDDEDEMLMKPEAAQHSHQGDQSPEGREEHIIKGKMGSEDEKEDKKIAEKQAKKEVKEHEDKMHKSKEEIIDEVLEKSYQFSGSYDGYSGKSESGKACKTHEKFEKSCPTCQEVKKSEDEENTMNKSLEEVKALKDEVIKSYEDAGLEYSDELIKAEMKKRMLKEEDQVKMGGQDKGGKKDRADKKSEPELEVGKDAEETADEAVAKIGKIKKSLPEADRQARLRANTQGRNYHFSINGYYDNALSKAQKSEESEDLKKSEGEQEESNGINDLIEKSQDQSFSDVASEAVFKSQERGAFTQNTFSDKELADAMNISESELKEILGENAGK